MGQSATLYRIDKNDFHKVEENPKNFGLFKIKKESVTFEKTFEGLIFLLSKNRDSGIASSIRQIFYPTTYVGQKVDFSNLDFDNLPDDFDFESEAVAYIEPGKVSEIATFLNNISEKEFQELFSADELNKNDIYPGDVWNNETSEDIAFNAYSMTEEFINLKNIFANANREEDYILSYVG